MRGTDAIRIVIADDQELVRTGLRLLLQASDDLEVVGEAADGVQAVELARRHAPDVVLMDIEMPRLSGIDATRRILDGAGHATRVVVLTTFSQNEIVYDALAAGASGFLLKDMPPQGLVEGIRAVARGEELLAPLLTRRLIEHFVRANTSRSVPELQRLTDREREVLQLIAHGLSNAEIADCLMVGRETVKTHVSRVLEKVNARDRVQAVVLAYRWGLVTASDQDPRGRWRPRNP